MNNYENITVAFIREKCKEIVKFSDVSFAGVYAIVNLMNNKIYIGSSSNMRYRLYNHRKDLRGNRHVNDHLQNAWNLYSENMFRFFLLADIKDDVERFRQEQLFIDNLHSFDADYGYNICPDAIGHRHSEITKKKISEAQLGEKNHMFGRTGPNHPNFGTHLSVERKEKLRQAHLGTKASEETKRKISLAGMGKKHTEEFKIKLSNRNKGNKWNLGRKMSDEVKHKISEAKKKRWALPEFRQQMSEKIRKSWEKRGYKGHTVTAESRLKIGNGIKEYWRKRRELYDVQADKITSA